MSLKLKKRGEPYISSHSILIGRELNDQHPISAITGLTGEITAIHDKIDKIPDKIVTNVLGTTNGIKVSYSDGAIENINIDNSGVAVVGLTTSEW